MQQDFEKKTSKKGKNPKKEDKTPSTRDAEEEIIVSLSYLVLVSV